MQHVSAHTQGAIIRLTRYQWQCCSRTIQHDKTLVVSDGPCPYVCISSSQRNIPLQNKNTCISDMLREYVNSFLSPLPSLAHRPMSRFSVRSLHLYTILYLSYITSFILRVGIFVTFATLKNHRKCTCMPVSYGRNKFDKMRKIFRRLLLWNKQKICIYFRNALSSQPECNIFLRSSTMPVLESILNYVFLNWEFTGIKVTRH